MRRWLLITLVVLLVLCIFVIVVSPYVDLPLTTLRACIAALLSAQVLLLAGGRFLNPVRSFRAMGSCPPGAPKVARGQSAELLHVLCAYLC